MAGKGEESQDGNQLHLGSAGDTRGQERIEDMWRGGAGLLPVPLGSLGGGAVPGIVGAYGHQQDTLPLQQLLPRGVGSWVLEFAYVGDAPGVVPRPSSSASPENLVEMQIPSLTRTCRVRNPGARPVICEL